MKKLIITVLAAIIVALPLIGCGPAELGKGLTEYTITAALDADQRTVTAQMSVNYVNDTQSELTELAFHLYGNAYREGAVHSPISQSDISSAYPDGLSYGYLTVSNVTDSKGNALQFNTDNNNDVLSVTIPSLMPTQRVTVNLKFKLGLAEIRHRLGYFSGKYNLGNWYPVLCAFRDGAWVKHPYYSNGDPFDSAVANYNIKFTYPTSMIATSTAGEGVNGVLEAKARAVRDFAIVVGNFNKQSVIVGDTTVTWYSEGSDDYTQVAKDALNTYNDLFGEYPYSTLAVVKTAFLNGGMEYPGLVYVSDALNDEMIKEVVAHEIAHQWWYGVVGNDQVNEAWMDEGLTEYTTTIFYEKNPSYGVEKDARIADSLTTYMLYCELYKDNGKSLTAMGKCVGDYATNMEYTYMTYVKGQLLFDCVRTLIGDKAFFNGLSYYYENYKFKIATMADMVGAFEKYSKYPLTSYFNSWVDGTALLYSVH
ncbi:MAG: M1 family metallopeptidase [Clostridiales bacterium]|nr:M1 family metallopeptidase [Clostridiales bacterium]